VGGKEKKLLTVEELAETTEYSQSVIRLLRRKGVIEGTKDSGGPTMYTDADLQKVQAYRESKHESIRDKIDTEWSTFHEIQLLRSLGSFSMADKVVTMNSDARSLRRIKLLENYIKAAARRVKWGKINKKSVLDEANRLLYKAIEGEPQAVTV